MMRAMWYWITAMWSEVFPSWHVRRQREMARARVEYLRRFGTMQEPRKVDRWQ